MPARKHFGDRMQPVRDCKRRYVAKMKQEGRCILCGQPAVAGHTRCAVHRDAANQHAAEQRRAAGRSMKTCSACEQPGHNARTCDRA